MPLNRRTQELRLVILPGISCDGCDVRSARNVVRSPCKGNSFVLCGVCAQENQDFVPHGMADIGPIDGWKQFGIHPTKDFCNY